MRRIDYPYSALIAPLDLLDKGLTKASPASSDEKKIIRSLYRRYRHRLGRADLIQPSNSLSVKLKADIKSGYKKTYAGQTLESVRDAIQNASANRCPSCGGSRPGQLDHHLPKDIYPEYALFTWNLIAFCEGCNRKKGVHAPNDLAEAFIHPYLDNVPRTPYHLVNVKVHSTHVSVTFSFDPNAAIRDQVMKSRMKFQFEKVDVNAQISSEVTEFIRECCDTIAGDVKPAAASMISSHLYQRAIRMDRLHSPACWQSALLRSLARCDEFCTFGYSLMLSQSSKKAGTPMHIHKF